jgi:hypothetical protein
LDGQVGPGAGGFDVGKLEPGVYLVMVGTGESRSELKLVVWD